jgi:hypothetical protein
MGAKRDRLTELRMRAIIRANLAASMDIEE